MRALIAAILLILTAAPALADWQSTLEAAFPEAKVVDTFDNLQDWGAGFRFASGAPTSAASVAVNNLPVKLDGSQSAWKVWNNKGVSAEYTPGNGTFAIGDAVVGAQSGETATVRQVWNVDGKYYLQFTCNSGTGGAFTFQEGENISSGSKTGSNLRSVKFIANHGSPHVWRGTGKSLMMNYGDNDAGTAPASPPMEGIGAQRMGLFFGDGVSGKSGYKKTHLFFMVFFDGTFRRVNNAYLDLPTFKLFDFDAGFTKIYQVGTDAEFAMCAYNSGKRDEYGVNYEIFNMSGGGASFPQAAFLSENLRTATGTAPNIIFNYIVDGRRVRTNVVNNESPMDLDTISEGFTKWIGIEAALDAGTMGNADGSTEVWVYDDQGNERGYFSVTGENKIKLFDHWYNKIVLGGNRLTDGRVNGVDSRYWYDDVIVNGSRIGPTYFATLKGTPIPDFTPPTTSVSPPQGSYTTAKLVYLVADDPAATIYYTTDESTPTTASTVYSGPINIAASTTLKFFAQDAAGNKENVKTASYTITGLAPDPDPIEPVPSKERTRAHVRGNLR